MRGRLCRIDPGAGRHEDRPAAGRLPQSPGRRDLRWAALLCLLAASAAGVGGCGIFDTRNPEPSQGPGIDYIPPTAPKIALTNVKVTLEAGSTINYESALAEDFDFVPASVDESCGALLDWSKSEEIRVHDGILATPADLVLTWTPKNGDFDNLITAPELGPNGETQEYYEDLAYELVFTGSQGTAIYSGRCDLYFREVDGLWLIYDWIDKEDGSGHCTWGRLRCFNVQFADCG